MATWLPWTNFMSVAAKLRKNWLLKWSCVPAYACSTWEAESEGRLATLPLSKDAK